MFYCGGVMDGVREIDSVLQRVKQATQRFCVSPDAPITQQILLFGNSFYGYRFTTAEFTAIWSAAEQTLKVCDHDGQVLEIFSTTKIRQAG